MELKCKICGKVVTNKMFKLHVKNQHINEFIDNNELEKFVIYERLQLTDELVNKLIDEYVNSGETVNNLVKRYGFKYKNILNILKINNIKIKGISEAVNENVSKENYKKKIIELYGVDNPSKSEMIKTKKKETFMKNYDVDNIFKDKTFINNLNDLMIKKYGVKRISGWFTMSEEQRNEQIRRITSYTTSNIEKMVGVGLIGLGVKFTHQFNVGRKIFDYKLNDVKILIEVNGDFWHANPIKYKENDLIHFPGGDVITKDIWEKDDKKRLLGENRGYKVITIWENDIKNLSIIELELYINELLNEYL